MSERTAVHALELLTQPNWRMVAAFAAIISICLLATLIWSIRLPGTRQTIRAQRAPRVRAVPRIGEATQHHEALAPLLKPHVDSKLKYIDFQEALALLHATLESLSARIAILDATGAVVEANEPWLQFTRGQPPTIDTAEPTGGKLQLPEDAKEGREMLAAFRGLVKGTRGRCKFVYQARDGESERIYEFSATRIESHGSVHVLVSHEDITDLREASVAAQELSKHISEIQEDERQRIAGELHDTTGQHLIAISLNVMNLRREMKVSRRVERLIEDIERSAEEAQQEIRLLSYLLYPPQLEHEGAQQTIEHYVEGFGRRANLDVRHRVTSAVDALPIDLQRSVLRIIQEAMANVHRHAEATSVMLTVQTDAKGLYVEVKDDGRGMQRAGDDASEPMFGVGIPGMRARLRQFNGTLQIESSNAGTVLKARIPSAGVRNAAGRIAPGSRALQ